MAMINGAIHPITMRSIAIAKVQPKGWELHPLAVKGSRLKNISGGGKNQPLVGVHM